VQFGVQTADRVQVVSGLAEGERIIVYSARQLDAGMRVREQQLMAR